MLACLAVVAACTRAPGALPSQKSKEISLFFTGELQGTIEPCGCTSDPLGDLARTAALIRAAGASGRTAALFDAGSTLYVPGHPPSAEDKVRAEMLAATLPKLGLVAAGLGPGDLAAGAAGTYLPRQAANVSGPAISAPEIRDIGGLRVGVFGVVDPAAVGADIHATDPVAAARDAIRDLRARGADIIISLAGMTRAGAKRLATDAPGADIVVVGAGLPDRGEPEPETVAGALLVVPGNRGQAIARFDLHWLGRPLADALGPERAAARGQKLEADISSLRKDLARWEKDPTAEAEFLARNRDDLAKMEAERAALREHPLRIPAQGSYFTFAVVPIQKGLACDAAVVAAKQGVDDAVGALGRRAAAEEKAPPVPQGQAAYAGVGECGACHLAAVAFWKKTRHADAMKTLVDVHKQWDRDCVSCHTTGWLEPGGAVFGTVDRLGNVQCEVCHGAGSLHVDSDGNRRDTLARAPAADLCASRCHTPEHSDTFNRDAYLRDITGPGHGAKLRESLGDGPTGHMLRQAALAKAGQGIGAG